MNINFCCNNSKSPFFQEQPTKLEKVQKWVYEHPTVIKVAEIAFIILGVALLAALPIGLPILGCTAVVIGVGVAATVLGGICITVGALALKYLEIVAPLKNDMTKHVYKPGKCENGELRYEGDVPVLTIDTNDPYKGGRAHGYLIGNAINILRNRWNTVQPYADFPKANEVPRTIENFKRAIPEEYLQEMQGIVDGFNEWASKQKLSSPKKMTMEEAILFHLIPDKLHFDPKEEEARINDQVRYEESIKPIEVPVGCTVVIDRDEENGITMGRNMDWPTFGVSGTYTLLIRRKKGDVITADVSMPGFVGVLTGMNNSGLSLAMNVCSLGRYRASQSDKNRLPATLLNRYCLDHCTSVEEVKGALETHDPLGPYHMSVSDEEGASSFSMYQNDYYRHLERPLKGNQPLIVTNQRYENYETHMHHSKERDSNIRMLFNLRRELSRGQLVEQSLALPFVNNSLTAHRVVMQPKTRTMRVAFDNAYAGDKPLHLLTAEALFN